VPEEVSGLARVLWKVENDSPPPGAMKGAG